MKVIILLLFRAHLQPALPGWQHLLRAVPPVPGRGARGRGVRRRDAAAELHLLRRGRPRADLRAGLRHRAEVAPGRAHHPQQPRTPGLHVSL